VRITTGIYKNRKLFFPQSKDIRPAMDKIKQCIFNVLGSVVEDAAILDIYAGCGSLGFEGLSRYGKRVTFIDNHPLAIKSIKKNIELLQVEDKTVVMAMSASRALKLIGSKNEQFNLIFLDPPYDKSAVRKALRQIIEFDILSTFGWVVIEHSKREQPEIFEGLTLKNTRNFGATYLSFIQKAEN